MKYLLMLYVPADTAEHEAVRAPMDAWFAYNNELQHAGALVSADPLQGLDAAISVRERDGELLVTDGPFAETKEMLGGYYLIDVPDLDAALAWAAKVPNAAYGSVEVRPIMEFDTP